MEKLNILDNEGNVIGGEYRDVIHKKGLLHAEVHVWCVTHNNRLIFQHRAKDKDTYPDLLDATAGGHVDLGETFEESALKELLEETGISCKLEQILFLQTDTRKATDPTTGMINHVRRNLYVLKQRVSMEDLHIETGKALGFVSYSFEELRNLNKDEKDKFIPTLLDELGMKLFNKIEMTI